MQKIINKIEDFSDEFFQSYYTGNHGGSNLLISKGEKTKRGRRADALITFKHPKGTLFTATLTTTTATMLSTLLYDYKKKGLSKLRFLTALVLLAGTGFLLSTVLHWGISLGIALVIAITGYIIHTVAEKNALKKRISTVVNSVQGFRANDQWLGLSVSSLTFRNNPMAAYFLSLCQEKGIGVITVGQRGKVVLLKEPQTVQANQNDFLSDYERGDKIRETFINPKLKVA